MALLLSDSDDSDSMIPIQTDVRETPKDTEAETEFANKSSGTQTLTNSYSDVDGVSITFSLDGETVIAIMASLEMSFASGLDPSGGAIIIDIDSSEVSASEREIYKDYNTATGGVNQDTFYTQYVDVLAKGSHTIKLKAKSRTAGVGDATIVGQVANIIVFKQLREINYA